MNARLNREVEPVVTLATMKTLAGSDSKSTTVGKMRKTLMAEKKAKKTLNGSKSAAKAYKEMKVQLEKRNTIRQLEKKSDFFIPTLPLEAAQAETAIVMIRPIEVLSDAAKSTLQREDDDAYLQGCTPKQYKLLLPPGDPNWSMPGLGGTKYQFRQAYKGLSRIRKGARQRSNELKRQLLQADTLVDRHRSELHILIEKRAANARMRLQLMNELIHAQDPVALVRAHNSAYPAIKSLLLAFSNLPLNNQTTIQNLGHGPRLLQRTIDEEAKQQHFAEKEEQCPEHRRKLRQDIEHNELPTRDQLIATRAILAAFNIFEDLDRSASQQQSDITDDDHPSVHNNETENHTLNSSNIDDLASVLTTKTFKQRQKLRVRLSKANKFAATMSPEFFGVDLKARLMANIETAGAEDLFLPLALFEQARDFLWAAIHQFIPYLARWKQAEDFLWQLRFDRLAAQEQQQEEAQRQQLLTDSVTKDDNTSCLSSATGTINTLTTDHGATRSTSPQKSRLKSAMMMARFERSGTRLNGVTDRQGVTRNLKRDDEFMDSDGVHGVGGQRVKLDIVEPLLREQLCESLSIRKVLRAELSALTQYAYEFAIIHVQRRTRGYLIRAPGFEPFLSKLARRRMYEAIFGAAIMIQSCVRVRFAFKVYKHRAWRRDLSCTLTLQCAVRRMFATRRTSAIRLDAMRKSTFAAAIILQGLVRRRQAYRLRALYARALGNLSAAAAVEWAATLIESAARRWLARNEQYRRKVELNLNQRLLSLAHRYLRSGDLWSFLHAINDDYKRSEAEADAAQQREMQYADTFVKKVLEARDIEHKEAWQRYAGSTEKNGNQPDTIYPGPRIRHLLQGLLNTEIRQSAPRRKHGIFSSASSLSDKECGASSSSQSTKSRKRNLRDQRHGSRQSMSESTGTLFTDDGASFLLEEEDFRERLDFSQPAGLTVLNDIPRGLNDSSLRLLHAAALRTFVPKTLPKGATSEVAFEAYIALPPSLAKTKHEMDAQASVAPWIAALTASGLTEIRELLPPSLLRTTLYKFEDYVLQNSPSDSILTAESLVPACNKLLIELVATARTAGGPKALISGKIRTAERYAAIKAGQLTNWQALRAVKMGHVIITGSCRTDFAPLRLNPTLAYQQVQHQYKKKENGTSTESWRHKASCAPSQDCPKNDKTAESPVNDANPVIEAHVATKEDESLLLPLDPCTKIEVHLAAETHSIASMKMEAQIESFVMEDIVQHGGLDAPMRVSLSRAAFFIIETPPEPRGRSSFRAFVAKCAGASHDEERKLVAQRVETAVALIEPYAQALEEVSVCRTRDYVRITPNDWKIPVDVADEMRWLMRRLTATATFTTTVSDTESTLPRVTEGRSRRARARCQQRLLRIPYDSRYSRGPMDPYGSPSYLVGASAPRICPPKIASCTPDDDELIVNPLFDGTDLEARADASARAAKQLPPRKRPGLSVEPEELVPLHLQPQEFVGGAHRSRNLAARVCYRARGLFDEYNNFIQTHQYGRDILQLEEERSSPSSKALSQKLPGIVAEEESIHSVRKEADLFSQDEATEAPDQGHTFLWMPPEASRLQPPTTIPYRQPKSRLPVMEKNRRLQCRVGTGARMKKRKMPLTHRMVL